MFGQLSTRLGQRLKKWLGMAPPPPIRDLAEVEAYLAGTSAYISQYTLYAYVKARAGTRFPELFENERFLTSLKIARWHIYAACLSDLALYFGARMAAQARLNANECQKMTCELVKKALLSQDQRDIPEADFLAYHPLFEARVTAIDWFSYAIGPDAFTQSPEALMTWAPIDEAMKKQDHENVTHNLSLRWKHIRAELVNRLDADAVCLDAGIQR